MACKNKTMKKYGFGDFLKDAGKAYLDTTIAPIEMLTGQNIYNPNYDSKLFDSNFAKGYMSTLNTAKGIGMGAAGISAQSVPQELPEQQTSQFRNINQTKSFAMGGNFPDEALQGIMSGGTHETNPMGGVNLGNRGLVEEGEFKGKNSKGEDYIFSDRLKPDKKSKSFAKLAESIKKKYSRAKFDNIEKQDMQDEIDELIALQEQYKVDNKIGQYAMGGKIPSYQIGGNLDNPPYYNNEPPNMLDIEGNTISNTINDGRYSGMNNFYTSENTIGSGVYPQLTGGVSDAVIPTNLSLRRKSGYPVATTNNNQTIGGGNYPELTGGNSPVTINPITTKSQQADSTQNTIKNTGDTSFQNENKKYAAYPAVAGLLGNAYLYGTAKPDYIDYPELSPEKINLGRQREILKRQAGESSNSIANTLGQTGRANSARLIGSQTALDKNLGDVLSQSYLTEETTNMRERGKVAAVNNTIKRGQLDANAMEDAAVTNRKEAAIRGGLGNVSQYSKDVMRGQSDVNSANSMLSIYGYKLVSDGKGGWKVIKSNEE